MALETTLSGITSKKEHEPTTQLRKIVGGGSLKILASVMMFVFVGMNVSKAADSGEARVRSDFENMAAKMPYLAIESVLFDRKDHSFEVANPQDRESHFQILEQATDRKYSKEELLDLLKHPDARVRTLAMIALFDRNDPTVLPALVELSNDETVTFDGYGKLSETWLGLTGIGPPQEKQTVGYLAKKMVAFYMERAGFYYGIKHPTQPGFEKYWEDRKNRSQCASWFAIKLDRANRGTSPTQPESIADIQNVRHQIDQLPTDDRAWTLLWLFGEGRSDKLTTESELLEMAKQLGPDRLMLMLQRKIPSTDPDLQPRDSNNWRYKGMTLFVLKHASELLRPEDADKLLTCRDTEADLNRKAGLTDPTSPQWWAVGAAHLKPSSASQIIHSAFDRIQGQNEYPAEMRSDLAVALWDVSGESQSEYLADWFYTEFPSKQLWSNWRRSFIENISTINDPSPKKLIDKLVKDPRFETIDWDVASLQSLANVINGWLGKPAVSQSEIVAIRTDESLGLKKQFLDRLRADAAQLEK